MTKDINPQLVTIARQSRGLSQTELAKKLSITQGKLSKMESGVQGVSSEILQRLSVVLKYPKDFFCQTESVYGLGGNIMYHRSRKSLTKKELDKIHAQIHIRRVHLFKLLNAVEISPNRIEPCDVEEYQGDAQKVAKLIHAHWKLPPGPINNLTNTIEAMGGIIIQCDFGTRLVDAISQAIPGMPPLFFVNINVPVDRLRFTLAHELAHIIMHTGIPYPQMEIEANNFAAEFLMPERDIRSSLDSLTLKKLALLKQVWKVSMAAILKRAEQLRKITEGQARYLWSQIGALGYRRQEPSLDLPLEKPSVFPNILDIHRNTLNYNTTQLSDLLSIDEQELRSIYFEPKSHLRVV